MTLTNITTYIAIRNSSASFLLDPLLCDPRYLAGLGQASGQADVALTMQRMPKMPPRLERLLVFQKHSTLT